MNSHLDVILSHSIPSNFIAGFNRSVRVAIKQKIAQIKKKDENQNGKEKKEKDYEEIERKKQRKAKKKK